MSGILSVLSGLFSLLKNYKEWQHKVLKITVPQLFIFVSVVGGIIWIAPKVVQAYNNIQDIPSIKKDLSGVKGSQDFHSFNKSANDTLAIHVSKQLDILSKGIISLDREVKLINGKLLIIGEENKAWGRRFDDLQKGFDASTSEVLKKNFKEIASKTP